MFGPDKVPDPDPTPAQYEHASLSYFTGSGRTTNTASYGAGAWQIDTTRYDAKGNSVWGLSAEGGRLTLDEGPELEATVGAADRSATWTIHRPHHH